MDEKTRNTLYLLSIVLFVVILSLTIVSFYFMNKDNSPYIISFFVKYHVFFMFSIAIIGLLFGFFSHLFLNKQLGEDRLRMRNTITRLLTLLTTEERIIIHYLIKNKGGSTQYELTKLEGMTKIKVHRAIEKLESKNIIIKERLGKINKIFLKEEIAF